MFVADTFGVSAPPFPVSASNNDPNMRTLLLPLVLRSILREEEEETLPTRATSRATAALRDETVLEHAEATRMYYLLLLSVVVCAGYA